MVMVEQRHQVRSKKGTGKSTEPQWPGITSGMEKQPQAVRAVSKPGRLWRARLASPQGHRHCVLSLLSPRCTKGREVGVEGRWKEGEH